MTSVRARAKAIPGAVRLVRWARRRWSGSWQRQYWQERQGMAYYQEVLRLARLHAPEARTVIDVGSANTPFILQFGWIPSKTNLDLNEHGRLRGVTNLKADFLVWQPDQPFDLVLCLQVLEHLEHPGAFAQRLLACGRTVIISVPYRWPRGHEPSHVQDPIDDATLAGWLGRPWIDQSIAREPDDGTERMIVVLEGTR